MIRFAMEERSLYCGESMDVLAQFIGVNPETDETLAVNWQSSDDTIISLHGKSRLARGMRAERVGRAMITAELMRGDEMLGRASITLTVTERPAKVTGDAIFIGSGAKHKIPPYFFGIGMNDRCALDDGTPFATPYMYDVVKDCHFKNVRVPGGAMSQHFDYRTGKCSVSSYNGEFQGFTLDDFYDIAEKNGVPAVYALNIFDDDFTPEEIVRQIGELKRHTTQPILVELGNEQYAAAPYFVKKWPTVREYAAATRAYYDAIKAAHPDVQVAVVALGKDMEKRILSNPNCSAFTNEEDWEFTQPGRVRYWNYTLGDEGGYDAVSNHPYTHQSITSYVTMDEFMRDHFIFNQDFYLNLLLIDRNFHGKPQWLSEWGDIQETMFRAKESDEKGRINVSYDMGIAVTCSERVFLALKAGCVDTMSYHALQDSSGFGIATEWVHHKKGDIGYLPKYHAFKKIGEVLAENDTFWDIAAESVETSLEVWPWCAQKITYFVHLPTVSAYGLGSADELRCAAMFNHTNHEMRVKIAGVRLRRTWSYGSENAIVDFMVKSAPSSAYAPSEDEYEHPAIYHEDFAEEILLPPFSMVMADTEGVAECVADGITGRISKLYEYEISHAAVVMAGHRTACIDGRLRTFEHAAELREGELMLPPEMAAAIGVQTDDWISSKTAAGDRTVYQNAHGLAVISEIATSFSEPYRDEDQTPMALAELEEIFKNEL
ncbi:MAG: hypothetical protein E7632_12550 [Ruminococcaceae bacterium]|nr:hypothetical protein [Oscillospiraceae bacterium]